MGGFSWTLTCDPKIFTIHAHAIKLLLTQTSLPLVQFFYFPPGPYSVGWAIGTCRGIYIFSHLGLLFLPHKVNDQVHCSQLCLLGRLLSPLSFKASPEFGCNATAVHFQLAFTYQVNSPPDLAFLPSSSGCMRFLHRWPYEWAEGGALV